MLTTAVVYKWRITNAKYIYITDEEDNGPFIYDMTDDTRVYSENITDYGKVDEVLIKRNASMFSEERYQKAFDTLKGLLKNDPDGYYLRLLDYTAYLKDIPECSENATDVTCNPIDIMLTADVTTLSPGENAVVDIDNTEDETLPDGGRMRIFNLSFGIPAGSKGDKGEDGKSAYQIAVDKGFSGTVDQWLSDLKGEKGEPGQDGIGTAGENGKSAFEIAEEQGFSGTVDEWLNSLKGEKGDTGTIGLNEIESNKVYNILGYDTTRNDGFISYFTQIYNEFILTSEEGEQYPDGTLRFNSNGRTYYEYTREYKLSIQFGDSTGYEDCKVVKEKEEENVYYVYYNNDNANPVMYIAYNGYNIYKADSKNDSEDVKNTFNVLKKVYDIMIASEEVKTSVISINIPDGTSVVNIGENRITPIDILNELKVYVEKTNETVKIDNFDINGFGKININPKTELSVKTFTDKNTLYSELTQKANNTNIHHFILESNKDGNISYESNVNIGTSGITLELLKQNSNVCDIIITNDSVKVNKNLEVKSESATFESEVKATVNGVNSVLLGVPIGSITMWAGNNLSIPTGWLLCDGNAYDKSTYPLLYDVIGDTFKTKIIINTKFQVPNLIQRFPLGASINDGKMNNGFDENGKQITVNTGLGKKGGNNQVILSEKTVPSHTHNITKIAGANNSANDDYKTFSTLNTNSTVPSPDREVDVRSVEMSSFGGNQAHSNMPPYIALNFIIKAY